MNTRVCPYCRSGEIQNHSEEFGTETLTCSVCHGSGQVRTDENGKIDYRFVFAPVLGVSSFLQRNMTKILQMADKHKLYEPKEKP